MYICSSWNNFLLITSTVSAQGWNRIKFVYYSGRRSTDSLFGHRVNTIFEYSVNQRSLLLWLTVNDQRCFEKWSYTTQRLHSFSKVSKVSLINYYQSKPQKVSYSTGYSIFKKKLTFLSLTLLYNDNDLRLQFSIKKIAQTHTHTHLTTMTLLHHMETIRHIEFL